ncbi:BMP family ABC transporter substrate-binding protein [Glaciibacter psychrotolerans]|uniref:Basic membrane protein A n=1 Tax=Glaciibacter psychrotolerans TaxID=670054 RepID=A0A7Z0EH31_9MICO|nr:BMP family ABC transporter substrate-binding protein [Leifsonia psychrotolerans]NYJ20789.1 basic membrane protein A [Leifsonia psychrotolerans]
MKTHKFVGISAAIAAGALLLTGCSAGGAATGDNVSNGKTEKSFIYVTFEPIGINKFLESGKVGIEEAAKKFGGTSKVFEGQNNAETARANLEAAVGEAPDVITMMGFNYEDLSKEFAEANADQEFLLIDACPADAPANLHCAVFREYEPSYLLGIEAGALTKTNKIGSVASVDIPFLHRYTDSFALGAKSVNPAIEDSQLFIGGTNPFADPAKGKEQALAMAATGRDQIFAVGAGSNGGIFEAADAQSFTSYGVDVNQCPDAPGVVGDGSLKYANVVLVSEIGKILDGTAEGVSSYGLAEGGMDIVSLSKDAETSQCTVMEHPDVVAQLAAAKQKIIDGEITIPDPLQG